MKCFSLFSGLGAFDLALRNQGHEVVGACEIDRNARRIYERHFPNVKVWEDATKLNPTELPEFDFLCAGFPCQSFSVAGKRRGFDDLRGTVFFEIARIVKEKRPKLFLLENVAGLLTHDKGETLQIILETIYDMGYDVQWAVFDSRYFVPQARKRIFFVGNIREKPIKQVFPLGEISGIFEKESTTYLPSLTASDYKGPSKQRIANIIVEEG